MKSLTSIRILAATLIICSVFTIFSCKKEASEKQTQTTDADGTTYSQESVSVESGFDDLDNISQVTAEEDDLAATDGVNKHYAPTFKHLRAIIGDCATITGIDSTYPKTLTIDFGDSCRGYDGITRSGKIVLTLSAPARKVGSVATLTLVNFYVEHIKIEGTKVVTNTSTDNTKKFNVVVTGGKVTFPGGRGYTYEAEKVREKIAGADTPDNIFDNIWKLTGEAHIRFNNGATIDFEITTPVIRKLSCANRSEGIIKMTVNNNWVSTLDYSAPSNGGCDAIALLTWANGTKSRLIALY